MQRFVLFLAPAAVGTLAVATLITAAALSATGASTPPAGSQPPPGAHRSATATATPTTVTGTTVIGTTGTGAHPATRTTTSPPTAGGPPSGRLTLAWPLSPRPVIYRRFEQPRNQWAHGHRGVDLLAAVGQPVLSASDGVVAFSGVIAGRGVITVRHSGGLRTSYEPVDERLASSAVVRQSTRIGVVSAAAGHCVPVTCLHWGAIAGQTYRDPLSLLGFRRPILLPLG